MFYQINTQFHKYSTQESISSLLEDLESGKNEISNLDLSMNTYEPAIFSKICSKIKDMKDLKKIKLESILDSLTYEDMCEILSLLSDSLPADLESFELPSNAVSCNFPKKFGIFLSTVPLRVLNLHNCGLGEDGLKRISEYLSKIENKENLVSLNLSKNRINVICDCFASTVSQFKNLSELILNANTIEDKSMNRFLKGLSNENLEIINLTDNFVCGDAIISLGNLVLNNKIKELYLQDIKVDEGDIKNFLEIIKDKKESTLPGALEPSIQPLILDISCNFFKQDSVEVLEKLCDIYFFKKLYIFDNDYDNIEKLKEKINSQNGHLIDEEEEESEAVDEEIISKLGAL